MKKINAAIPLFLLGLFMLPQLAQASFKDVSSKHLNFKAIEYVQSKGIVEGYDDETYKPDRTINRAEFTKILIESQFTKEVIENCNNTVFSDVPKDEWFTPYICVAQSNKIVKGYADQTYRPNQNIAFTEAAKILVNTFQFEVEEGEIWYKPFVERLTEKKAIPTTIEKLEKEITRGEMAEMIWRLKEKITNKESKTLAELEILQKMEDPLPKSNRKISITSGKKHSVPLNSIMSGGPKKDGIPSIDHPKFTSIREANKLIDDESLGISVSIGKTHRFYPNQILVWHEIVNDQIEGQPALITYCPLCGTGIVYEPIVNGKITEFGTSGKLWNSNLVMYDRQTDSYWSQVLGESIVGTMTGTRLRLLPHDNLLYKDWKKLHPKGEVLSKETGHIRDYSKDPYGDYYNEEEVFFPLEHESDRFHPKEITFGIELNGKFKAYNLSELKKTDGEFLDTIGNIELNIKFDSENQTIQIERSDTNEEIIPTYGFWFSWYSVHPNTDIFLAE